ncbi:MAG: BrnT family toxin, partial [Proteobacteria bacterium]|nr:BrnT family toxin [Pseudomonadota bacterium]
MDIEYDEEKQHKVFKERGLDFEDVPIVFRSPRRITWQDTRKDYGEIREITVGELSDRIVVIVHTKRGKAIRVISM